MVMIGNIKTNGITNLFYSICIYHIVKEGKIIGLVTKMVNGYHWKYKNKWNNESILFYLLLPYNQRGESGIGHKNGKWLLLEI